MIAEGMEIMAVDAKRCDGMSKAEVEALINEPSSVAIAVREPISGFAVVIDKEFKDSLGISIAEGGHGTFFVGELEFGGPAWSTGLIGGGMQIVGINGKKTVGHHRRRCCWSTRLTPLARPRSDLDEAKAADEDYDRLAQGDTAPA